jgi:hypothetical protein
LASKANEKNLEQLENGRGTMLRSHYVEVYNVNLEEFDAF